MFETVFPYFWRLADGTGSSLGRMEKPECAKIVQWIETVSYALPGNQGSSTQGSSE